MVALITGEALLPQPSPAAAASLNIKQTVQSPQVPTPSSLPTNNSVRYPISNRGRGGHAASSPASRGGRGSYRGTVIRPARPPAPTQSAARGKAPFNIQNMTISISLGLSITAPGEKKTALAETPALAQSPGMTN